ncbi:MAG: hypothetical protein ACE5J4_02845 [Candidatus Aenigmatarchaeota archaeon]
MKFLTILIIISIILSFTFIEFQESRPSASTTITSRVNVTSPPGITGFLIKSSSKLIEIAKNFISWILNNFVMK